MTKLECARYGAYLRQFVYSVHRHTDTTTNRTTNLIISSNSLRSISGNNDDCDRKDTAGKILTKVEGTEA